MDVFIPFEKTELNPLIIKGLVDSGRYRATGIQAGSIANAIKGNNIILFSAAGTGKTCAFCINILHFIAQRYCIDGKFTNIPGKGNPLGIVIVPTPELCQQVAQEMTHVSRYIPISIHALVSSINMEEDWTELLYANILITTPGILLKNLKKKKIKLNKVLVCVIDEWDKQITDKLLSQDIIEIFKRNMPEIQQFIASSATFSNDGFTLLQKVINVKWNLIKATQPPTIGSVRHFLKRIGSFEKRIIFIINLFRKIKFHQALVFCNIHDLAAECCETLNTCGFPAEVVSARRDQKDRLDELAEFRDLTLRVLVTTDLTCRGIDIANVNVVINLDMPHDPQTFLHRVGRVGRFGSDGISVTLMKRSECREIPTIKAQTGLHLEAFSYDALPEMHLPPLQNEIALQNYHILLKRMDECLDMVFTEEEEPIEENKEKSDMNTDPEQVQDDKKPNEPIPTEPRFSFLDDPEYWRIYREQCSKYSSY